jgi:phosphoadenosine phosphosulfate reductase
MCAHGINAFYESVDAAQGLLLRAQGRTAQARPGRQARLDHRPARPAGGHPQRLPTREYDEGNGLEKFNPLADWSEKEVWTYIKQNGVPYNALHDKFYPSIGCAPARGPFRQGRRCPRRTLVVGNPESKECGLHVKFCLHHRQERHR